MWFLWWDLEFFGSYKFIQHDCTHHILCSLHSWPHTWWLCWLVALSTSQWHYSVKGWSSSPSKEAGRAKLKDLKSFQTIRCVRWCQNWCQVTFQNLLHVILPKLSHSPTVGPRLFHCFQTSPSIPSIFGSHVLVQAALSTDPIVGAGADDTSIATGGSCWET